MQGEAFRLSQIHQWLRIKTGQTRAGFAGSLTMKKARLLSMPGWLMLRGDLRP
jgi:hypothetical protein